MPLSFTSWSAVCVGTKRRTRGRRGIEGPVDATDPAALLARIPSDRERHAITTHYPSPSRPSTAEPPEAQDYMAAAHQAADTHLLHMSRGIPARLDAGAARTLRADHGFVEPFRLQADSTQQDQWTPCVEYLAFECCWLEKLDVAAGNYRKKSSRAPEYQTARAEVDHQQRRLDWVRSEISNMEAELKAAGKSGGSCLKKKADS
ncbi:hypothetical protein BU26DRAFT_568367 [Trematosphaeria pertusa]|uniref:Uncharacterized protein n=1 Tax=Trematosphaeria pertusa TaxID=390896 RepID=A0A6A6I3Y8_9PLEO|nr:uncharacterized protein BU26DRAFT_568367 [Trematosphaeria pertusa]KAF2245061.1 hypothetical protein BU26DRAFT_568367 [Trematosphaeria pertusa]